MKHDLVSWQDAEDALMAAVERLGALGDREHGFLSAGRKSSMPRVLRIEQSDYPDRPDPRLRLSARELREVEAMLLGRDAMVLAIPEQHRALVGRVITLKLWPEQAGGFRWSAVREAMRERSRSASCSDVVGKAGPASSSGAVGRKETRVPAKDALRMRYERAIGALARAMMAKARNSAGECVKTVPHSPGQI